MASGSLLETPPGLDALPRYTRDPETTSIRSSAPSYTSEAPSYHSNLISPSRLPRSVTSPPNCVPTTSRNYTAPGYSSSSRSSVSNVQHHAYNISEWSSATNGPRARHYQAVANRRVNDPSPRTDPNPSLPTIQSLRTVPEESNPTPPQSRPITSDSEQHMSPLEDPELVGPEAAAHATARRRCAEEQALLLKEEQQSWDFMLAQMADWKERERSWEGFRRGVQEKRFLGGMGLGRKWKRR
ncbi:hypothetical protein MMC07_003105 [Pseudocyphellaria aurata]|nr:hypothetical protein [Pseudocyphellaria aurata]